MTPMQFGQLLCAVAIARSAFRMEIIGGGSEPWRRMSRELAFTVARDCRLFIRQQRTADCEERCGAQCPHDWLMVAPLFTDLDLLTLNVTLSENAVPRLSWAIVALPEMLNSALNTLPWQLDNQVLLLTVDDEVGVWEAYRPAPQLPVRSRRITHLSPPPIGPTNQQLRTLGEDLLDARNDLRGLVIKCSVLEWSLFSQFSKNPDGTLNITGGFYGDIWILLQDMLGFTGVCREPKDGAWGGGVRPLNDWYGILGEVHRGVADISPSPYIITKQRREGVEFSTAIENGYSILVIKKPKRIDGGSNYTQEFSTLVWCMILVFYGICVMMMKLMTKISRTEAERDISHTLIANFRIICNMGFEDERPRGTPYRSWLLMLVTMVSVLHVYYTAFLTASVTSAKIKLPFEDLYGLYAQGDYQLGTTVDTYLEAQFKYSTDPIMQKLWSTSINPHNLMSIAEAVPRLKTDSKFAFMLNKASYKVSFRDCEILELPRKYFRLAAAMPMTLGRPHNPILNRALTKIIESGVLQHRYDLWFGKNANQDPTCPKDQVAPLGLRETYTAFVLLGMIAGSAVVIFALERVKCSRKK